MHLELLELQRRIQVRVTLPCSISRPRSLRRHQAEARPLLRFEDIPLDLTDLRLMVRQTADVLRRFGALEESGLRQGASRWARHEPARTGGRVVSGRGGTPARGRSVSPGAARDLGRRYRAAAGDRARDASVPLAMRGSPSAASRTGELDPRALRAVRRRARSRGDHALSRTSPDLRTMLAAMEVRAADLSLLPQQRSGAHHVVCDD